MDGLDIIRNSPVYLVPKFTGVYRKYMRWLLAFAFIANFALSICADDLNSQSTSTSSGAVSKNKIDALYNSINAEFTCGLSLIGVEMDFDKNFPENEQADALATVIERAAKTPKDSAVIGNALSLAERKNKQEKTPWSPRLKAALLNEVNSTDSYFRETIAGIFINRPDREDQQIGLSILEDNNDEVRKRVVDAIIKSQLEDEEKLRIYRKFIQEHSTSASYAKSVQSAKLGILCQQQQALFKEFNQVFTASDGTNIAEISDKFFKEVPSSMQSGILEAILMTNINNGLPEGSGNAANNVLSLLETEGGLKMKWEENLPILIACEAITTEEKPRNLIANLLLKKKSDPNLAEVFQDSRRDDVRCFFLQTVRTWPNADKIYQTYIDQNQADAQWPLALQTAKNELHAVQDSGNSHH